MKSESDHKWIVLVGAKIRHARERQGLNLLELARLTGISASALSLIETGKRDLRISSLNRIAKALRVAPGDLININENDQPSSRHAIGDEGYDLGDYA